MVFPLWNGAREKSMKVAVLAFSINGAMGQHLHCWVEGLGEGADVTAFAPSHYAYSPRHYRWRSFETGSTKWRAAKNLLSPRRVARLGRDLIDAKPDVVHLFNGEGYPGAFSTAAACVKAGIPFVTTIHDVVPHSGDPFMQFVAVIRKYVVRKSRLIHLHSARHQPAMVKQGALPEQIRIIPVGSLAPIYQAHRRDFPPPPGNRVLFFGRITSYKGVDVLAEAAHRLPPDILVEIAGPGKIPEGLAQKLAHPRFVLHNRYLADAEVTALFQRASVCVLPYRDATQSTVPLISASFGVPVVASAVGAFVEDVPQINGLLVPPGDPGALARGIASAFGRPVEHPPAREFSVLKNDYLRIYAEAIASARASTPARPPVQTPR